MAGIIEKIGKSIDSGSVIDKMRNENLIDICRRGNKSYYVRL